MTKRKSRARDRSAAPVSVARSVRPQSKSLDTFRVARANEILAASLPQVIYQSAPRAPIAASARPTVQPVQQPSRKPASRAALSPLAPSSARSTVRPRPLNLRESEIDVRPQESQSCKARPDDSRKSGAGAARPFVPWCSKRS